METLREEPSDQEIFAMLDETVAKWFKEKYGTFTPPQRGAIPEIVNRRNVLVSSPTGSGKTLAAFLGIISELAKLGKKGLLEDKIYAVYVSPLRALNNDMRRNLSEPLQELRELDKDFPEIRVSVRTSDTSPSEKQKMLKKPPHILITTPESFGISLTSLKFKEKLATAEWIIIDEIHELASSKRGSYLMSMVELLEKLVKKSPIVRVGLSATISPLEEVAKFLVGPNRSCKIVDARFVKPVDIRVVSPVRDLVHATEEEVEKGIYDYLVREIKRHKTTLIFTNTRSATERVSYKLRRIFESSKLYDADKVAAHHSSLSREVRLDVEEKLKRGDLKVVVSSTSLELGIDIGYIDLVILLSSPKSVSRLLQRIGRAGHHIKAVSEGRIVVVDRDDLVECANLAELARRRKIDSVHIVRNPLDVLAQVIMAASLMAEVKVGDLYEILRGTYTFSDLTWEDYKLVLDYLTGKYGLEENKVYSKVKVRDDTILPKFGLRMMYMMNSGTIPDEAKVPVRLENGRYIGNLEEEFVEILSPGDIFVLAGKTYEFIGSRAGEVIVRPAEGQRPTVPSWFSEMLPLAYDSAREIAKFRGEVAALISEGKSPEEIVGYIQERLGVGKKEAHSIYTYILEEYLFTDGVVPSDNVYMVEIYDEPDGSRTFIYHVLVGRRTLDALSRAFANKIAEDLNVDVKITLSDNGFALTIPERVDYDPKKPFYEIKPEGLYDVLKEVILRTEMLKRRFRHVAERSFMVLRKYRGKEKSLERRQLSSETLLEVVKKIEDFPVLKETIREILEDYMDIHKAEETLRRVQSGEVEVIVKGPYTVPSPFSHGILLKEYSDVVLAADKRNLLAQLHEKVIEYLKEKGVNVDLLRTSA